MILILLLSEETHIYLISGFLTTYIYIYTHVYQILNVYICIGKLTTSKVKTSDQ